MFLAVRNITKSFGSVTALSNVNLDIEEGSFVCFLGPSGCGKTTLLRIIAGLETPNAGDIRLGNMNLADVPARRRNFGVVFQSYSLFPNMTVAKNVAYGLECQAWRRERVDRRVRELLSLVHLDDQTNKLPHQLSGGQQQRVALARALAPEPSVLLLDEPLSALDAKVREDLRGEIRDLQARLGITTVMVTHDQEEAMEMADQILVMNKGKIEQMGSAVDLYERPVNLFVAEFIGRMNLLRVDPKTPSWLPFLKLRKVAPHKESWILGIRPEQVELATGGQESPEVVVGTVEKVVYLGSVTRIKMAIDDQKLLVELRGRPNGLAYGHRLAVRIPAPLIHFFEESAR